MRRNSSETPLLSIIIPHYDAPDRLVNMLESIFRQSLKSLEVIVVDDCSPHSCAAVVDAFAAKGMDIHLKESAQRVHTMQARLMGMAAARGDTIYFVDADDRLWGNYLLETHVSQFREAGADVLHFAAVLTDSAGKFKEYAPLTLPFAPDLSGSAIFEKYVSANFWGASALWNKLFSRSLAMRVHDVAKNSAVMKHVEDSYLVTHLLFHSQRYIGSERIGYGYWYEDKMKQHAYERALYSYYMLQEIPAYLQHCGCAKDCIDRWKRNVSQYFTVCAGKMCMNIVSEYGDDVPDAVLSELIQLAPVETLVKMLLQANQKNAQTIVNTVHSLFPQS